MTISLLAFVVIAACAFGVYLLAARIGRSRRGFREGPLGAGEEKAPSLRGFLFRTVLLTLLALFVVWTALMERDQRDQRWPLSDGRVRIREARQNGATWLDRKAQLAMEAALKQGIDGNPAGSGDFSLDSPSVIEHSQLPSSAAVALRSKGWAIGTGVVRGEERQYVAWRANKDDVVYYFWGNDPWYWRLAAYLVSLAFGIVILSPFAAVAAWFLNRRIVKPVQQVAAASVVLAEGGEPMRIPTKAPRELAVMAASFNRMAGKLRRAQDTEHDFLLSVGHELKTPLTAIDGYAELLADEAVDPRQAAEVLGLESARLRRLVGDLLDLARIGRSEFTVLDEDVDLAVISRQASERFAGAATARGVSLEVDAPEPAMARGDHGRLLQIASNLVENALRVTPEGGQVRIVARAGLLEVSDTGPGLPAEDAGHAFERFYLHRKYGDPHVGTGLGLAIVKELAEAMEGEAEIVSAPAAGSTFRIRLRP